MGFITVPGIPYEIEIKGDKPDKDEAARIIKLVDAFKNKKEADNPFTDEKMRKVYETNDQQLIEAVEKAKETWEKTVGVNLLEEFGFEPLDNLGGTGTGQNNIIINTDPDKQNMVEQKATDFILN